MLNQILKIANYLDSKRFFKQSDDLIKLAFITGEYWLTKDGPTFADGDIGDYNHELLAENHILNELNWENESDYLDNFSSAESKYDDLLYNEPHYLDDFIQEQKEKYGENYENHIYFEDYILWLNLKSTNPSMHKQIEESVKDKLNGKKDPRLYVQKNYDWVRIQGKNIEVWSLNDVTIDRIKQQIDEIVYQEEAFIPEDWQEKPVFSLYIGDKQKLINNVSYNDIIDGTIKNQLIRPETPPDTISNRPSTSPLYKYQGG